MPTTAQLPRSRVMGQKPVSGEFGSRSHLPTADYSSTWADSKNKSRFLKTPSLAEASLLLISVLGRERTHIRYERLPDKRGMTSNLHPSWVIA